MTLQEDEHAWRPTYVLRPRIEYKEKTKMRVTGAHASTTTHVCLDLIFRAVSFQSHQSHGTLALGDPSLLL